VDLKNRGGHEGGPGNNSVSVLDSGTSYRQQITKGLCLLGVLLAGADLAKGAIFHEPLDWWWFSASVALWSVLVGGFVVLSRPGRARSILSKTERIAGVPGKRCDDGINRPVLAAVAAVALITALVGGAFVHHVNGQHVPRYDGDDCAVRSALTWHRAIFDADVVGGFAEPRPTYIVAGFLGGGQEPSTILAGRVISLASAVSLVVLIALYTGARGGWPAALLAGIMLQWDLTHVAFKFTEDSAFILVFSAGLLSTLVFIDKPRYWPVVGFLAGLAVSLKGSGVCLPATFTLALVLNRGIRLATLPHLCATVVAAAIPLGPNVYWVLTLGHETKGTQLTGFLELHLPEAIRALWIDYYPNAPNAPLPVFHGWGQVLWNRVGLMTVGDLAAGAAIAFVPRAWIAAVLLLAAIVRRSSPEGKVLLAHLAVTGMFLGLLGWKLGDTADPFPILGPAAAMYLGLHGRLLWQNFRTCGVVLWGLVLVGPTIGIFVWRTFMIFRG